MEKHANQMSGLISEKSEQVKCSDEHEKCNGQRVTGKRSSDLRVAGAGCVSFPIICQFQKTRRKSVFQFYNFVEKLPRDSNSSLLQKYSEYLINASMPIRQLKTEGFAEF